MPKTKADVTAIRTPFLGERGDYTRKPSGRPTVAELAQIQRDYGIELDAAA